MISLMISLTISLMISLMTLLMILRLLARPKETHQVEMHRVLSHMIRTGYTTQPYNHTTAIRSQ